MRQIVKTVRTFSEMIEAEKAGEVSSNALEKARTWMKETATDHDWYDCTTEWWETALAQIGFEDAKIAFRGFWSQGDGASFTCDRVNVKKLASFLSTEREAKDHVEVIDGEEDFRSYLINKLKWKKINFNHQFDWIAFFGDTFQAKVIRTCHQYCHYNTCDFEIERCSQNYNYNFGDTLLEVLTDFEKQAEELREELSKVIYKDLEEDYYAQTEDEALIEFGDANDYTFDEYGNREG